MNFDILLLILGFAAVFVLLRACDPFGIEAIRRGEVPGAFLTKPSRKRPVRHFSPQRSKYSGRS